MQQYMVHMGSVWSLAAVLRNDEFPDESLNYIHGGNVCMQAVLNCSFQNWAYILELSRGTSNAKMWYKVLQE